MEHKGKFFCSRTERGASACAEQCKECAQRVDDLLKGRPAEAAAAPEPAQDKVVEMPKAPGVRASLSVTLFTDGGASVDGPYDDRLLFHGLVWLAQEAERKHAAQVERLNAQRARETRFQRWLRERGERKAREAADKILRRQQQST